MCHVLSAKLCNIMNAYDISFCMSRYFMANLAFFKRGKQIVIHFEMEISLPCLDIGGRFGIFKGAQQIIIPFKREIPALIEICKVK